MYLPGSHPGLLLFRPRSMGPFVVDLGEHARCNLVVEDDRVRLRRPPPECLILGE